MATADMSAFDRPFFILRSCPDSNSSTLLPSFPGPLPLPYTMRKRDRSASTCSSGSDRSTGPHRKWKRDRPSSSRVRQASYRKSERTRSPANRLPHRFALPPSSRSTKDPEEQQRPASLFPSILVRNDAILDSFCSGRSNFGIIWKRVRKNKDDIEIWALAIKAIENEPPSQEKTMALRAAFVHVLRRWPYCYGYWCKWATLEAREGEAEIAIDVYEAGLEMFPHSVDIWLAYLHYMKAYLAAKNDGPAGFRRLAACALSSVGNEWRSDKVWAEILEFEIEAGNHKAATALLDRLIAIPTARLDDNFDRLKKYLRTHGVEACLSSKDIEKLEGRRRDQELEEVAISQRRLIHSKTLLLATEMAKFEDQIKRGYFHTRPLDRSQLENWMEYMDWALSAAGEGTIMMTFNRATTSCALYDAFWIKFADWHIECGRAQAARDIFRKATEIHCPKSALMALAYSAFEERQGDFYAARKVLEAFDHHCPGHLLIHNRLFGLQRRKEWADRHRRPNIGNDTSDYYRDLIGAKGRPIEHKSYLSIRFARFLQLVKDDIPGAERVIRNALKEDPANEQLHLCLVDLALAVTPLDEDRVIKAMNGCITSGYLSTSARIRFSQRKLDFLEELGTDIRKIQAHVTEHTRLLAAEMAVTGSTGPFPTTEHLYHALL